jgi:hypothetical protein
LSVSGPKPRSAQMHRGAWPTPAVSARPTRTARARPVATRAHGAWSRGCGLRSLGQPRPAWPTTARRSAAHDGAVTAPTRASWRGRRWRHSGGDGANGGGRAPTTVRLPVGHGGRHASSPELLVDGEEKKSISTAASPRRGGATVAGGGPATVRRERMVSSSSTGEERRGEALGRRSPDEARDGEGGDNGEGLAQTAGRGAFGQGCADTAGWGGGSREAAVGRSGRAALSEAARQRRGSAVTTRGRAVPIAALSHCADTGPARRTTADKRGPFVSDFRIKIYPEEN